MTIWKDSWKFPRFQRKAKRANLQVFFIMSLCVVSSAFNLDQCKIKSIILSSSLGVLLLLPFQFLFSISVCLRGYILTPYPIAGIGLFELLISKPWRVLYCAVVSSNPKPRNCYLPYGLTHQLVHLLFLRLLWMFIFGWPAILHTLAWYSLYGRIWLVVFDRKKSVWWCWAYSNYWL